MAVVRWQPFSLRWPNVWDWDEDEMMSPTMTSGDNLDIFETEDEVVVRANIAGVDDSKVEITFEKGVLWIRAEETEEKKDDKKFYRKASRSYSYKVAVPGNIDFKQDPAADIERGIVTIRFRKAEEAKPRRIAISRGKK